MAWLERQALELMCARCEARPGQDCVTITGAKATRFHSARTNPLMAAWRAGYNSALVMSAAHPEAFKRQVQRHVETD